MKPITSIKDLSARLQRAQREYTKRNNMVALCDEMYLMSRERKSSFLDSSITGWRDKVAAEYWESSNKAQNILDILTAVLSGNPPQFHCTVPGNVSSTIPSRAELFLNGVFRINSRRQQIDLHREIVFRTVKDGSAAVRVYWQPDPTGTDIDLVGVEDEVGGVEPWVAQNHTIETFPINIEVVDTTKVFPMGRGRNGKPFSEVFYVQKRNIADVVDEWENRPGADVTEVTKGVKADDWATTEDEYTEWWGQESGGQVWYAIAFRNKFIIEPTKIDYPEIPFVITSYKKMATNERAMQNLPALYPLFHAMEKLEYARSRSFRLLDMFANMNPYHAGETAIRDFDATWGKIIELGPKEDIRFPQWPGQPPDIYKEMQQLEGAIAEGSFSPAMFGQVSTRVSGYALSQVIGSDTLRTDIPRTNLELAYSSIADLIFGLMRQYSPATQLAVAVPVAQQKVSAMLAGEETKHLVVETFVKPKQTSDEVRLAGLGAQLASLPNPPVSMRYILEHYFGVNQPEEEMARKLDEEAQKDPVVRLMALVEVLVENDSPFAPIMQQQLQQAIQQTMMQQSAPQMPQGIDGIGLGIPQALGGNPPMPGPTGNPSEEAGFDREALMMGGPAPSGGMM